MNICIFQCSLNFNAANEHKHLESSMFPSLHFMNIGKEKIGFQETHSLPKYFILTHINSCTPTKQNKNVSVF